MVEQTKQAFKLDAEGRRRRTVGEDYEERSREAGKQVVETVAGMLPGVGTAMTVEEIREELQREDPNYRKIALLGGAELIGLIPGLGTAAKAGLRKVADKVGAGKIVEALDAPKPKPESTMIEEPKIISFTKKKEDKELKDFNKNLISSISEQASKQAKLVGELQEAGIYGDYQKGVRVQSQNYKGEALPPYTITGLSLTKVKLNNSNLKRTEDRLKIKFEYIEKDGDYYLPMLNVEQTDGTKSQVYLDALKQRNTPVMGGPKDIVKKTPFEKTGHTESVYHYTTARKGTPKEDVLDTRQSMNYGDMFDGIGVHVGTARAAEERGTEVAKSILESRGYYGDVDMNDPYLGKFMSENPDIEVGSVIPLKANLSKPLQGEEFGLGYKEGDRLIPPSENQVRNFLNVERASLLSEMYKELDRIPTDREVIDRIRQNLIDDGYTHIPYTNELEDVGSTSFIVLDPKYLRSTSAKFDPKDKDKAGLGLNKGGTVMNKQMEMAFMQQGGLKDDGMRKDPVSGNEVPSGSMAKEVRDDIPAQLSEGEYVVPADVVRFFGVKHFEDLRNKAKDGLNKMDKDGRIGGEPVPVGGPKAGPMGRQMAMGGDLTPEELQEIKKMAEGGMVQMSDPYQQQQSMYQQPRAMQSGGITGEFVTSTGPASPQRPIYTGEFSYEKPGAGAYQPPAGTQQTQQTPVTLYGPNGEVITLMLPKDQVRYNELIAQGYTTTAPTVVTPQPRDDDDDDDVGGEEDNPTWMDKYDYTNFDNLAQQTSAALDGPTTMLGSAAEFVFGGGVLGKLAKASNAAQVAANIAILKAQGQEVKGLTDKFNNYVNDNNLGELKNFITGSRLAKQINTTQVDAGLFKDSTDVFGNKIFKTEEEFNKQMQKNAGENYKYDPTITTPVDHDDDDSTPPINVSGGYKRTGSLAPTAEEIGSIRPGPRPLVTKPTLTATEKYERDQARESASSSRIDDQRREQRIRDIVSGAIQPKNIDEKREFDNVISAAATSVRSVSTSI